MESHEQEYHNVPNGAQGWREQVQLLSPTVTYA